MFLLFFFLGGGGDGRQMVEMIFQFADFALKRCPEQGKIQVVEQHFHVSRPTNPVRCKTLSTKIKKNPR